MQAMNTALVGRARQRGVVLMVALVLLAAGSLVTAVSMRSSVVQERLTGNHNLKQMATLDAETRTTRFLRSVGDWIESVDPPDVGNVSADAERLGDALVAYLDTQCAESCGVAFDRGAQPGTVSARVFDWSQTGPELRSMLVAWQVDPATDTPQALPFTFGTSAAGEPFVAVAMTGFAMGGSILDSNELSRSSLRVQLRFRPVGEVDEGPVVRGPFSDGLMACDGFTLTGSGAIDSFDSRRGFYGATVPGEGGDFLNRDLREVTLASLSPTATGTLSGAADLRGDVRFTGASLALTGSGTVLGNVHAQGDVSQNGVVGGDLVAGGDVHFGSRAEQQGAVVAGGGIRSEGQVVGGVTSGGNAVFTTSSSQGGTVRAVGNVTVQSTGNPPKNGIRAGGTIQSPGWWNDDNAPWTNDYRDGQVVAAPTIEPAAPEGEACDILGLRNPDGSLGDRFVEAVAAARKGAAIREGFLARRDNGDSRPLPPAMVQIGITGDVTLRAANLEPSHPDWSGHWEWQNRLTLGREGSPTVLEVGRNFTIDGSIASDGLRIEGDVTLVVRGDFTLGSNHRPIIAPGGSLTLLVEGRTTLGAGSELMGGGQPFVIGEGESRRARMTVYSAYQGGGNGVTISGANASNAAVYAPYARVAVTAGGVLSGAVRARQLEVSGAAPIRYDVALADLGTPGGATSGGSGLPEGFALDVLSWREFNPTR